MGNWIEFGIAVLSAFTLLASNWLVVRAGRTDRTKADQKQEHKRLERVEAEIRNIQNQAKIHPLFRDGQEDDE